MSDPDKIFFVLLARCISLWSQIFSGKPKPNSTREEWHIGCHPNDSIDD